MANVKNLDLSFLSDLESTIEDVPVEDLKIDPKIQRPENPAKIKKIYFKFTPSGIGTLLVSRRTDGDLIVLDGQTRRKVLLLKLPEGGPKTARCEIFDGLTEAQEAALFLVHNDGTKPRATDSFRIAGVAGNEVVLGVNEILRQRGFKVSTFPADGNISAVVALERIYTKSVRKEREPNTLELTLLVLNRAWGHDRDMVKGQILEGLAAFLDEYGSKVDIDRLIDKLRDMEDGPTTLILEGQRWSSIQKIRKSMGIAAVLVYNYNEGLKAARFKLPEWRRKA